MPLINIDRTYADGDILFEADLDNIKTACETLLNTTLLDSDNFQTNSIVEANINSGIFTTSDKIETYTIPVTKVNNSAVTNAKITTATLPMRATSSYSGSENTSSTEASAANGVTTSAVTTSTRGVILNGCGGASNGGLYSSLTPSSSAMTLTSTVTGVQNATTKASITLAATLYYSSYASGTVFFSMPISSVRHPLGQTPAESASINSNNSTGVYGKVKETELR